MRDTCGLYVDLRLNDALIAGDCAGARYLVVAARKVKQRSGHAQRNRWSLRCVRLERGIAVPEDVRVVWLRWYRRAGKRGNRLPVRDDNGTPEAG